MWSSRCFRSRVVIPAGTPSGLRAADRPDVVWDRKYSDHRSHRPVKRGRIARQEHVEVCVVLGVCDADVEHEYPET